MSSLKQVKQVTIYEKLKETLGREPTHKELCTEVRRIILEATKK
jgi:hypothetical protein